ncbi:peptide-methionine (S)-S-oxide reductase MsrA [Aquimonas voraii]|uniref:Peptide methionine sulfoxide reductase MsrA n=1 Tax=Aquimonas voraii TaxID=265719 RepID=A0A1G6U244_9GAMM|nr:peptide-methionine (S)-S-oxide reductase MsrA [Aquimonas voraii]SDD35361.1 peptide-methionine (S)-S-oxide reductase [Aquimonas voraii]
MSREPRFSAIHWAPWLAILLKLGLIGTLLASDVVDVQISEQSHTPPPVPDGANVGVALFAGGCFWCMEKPFDQMDGVLSTTSGYAGGTVENPSYEQVSAGGTGHIEVVEVRYDPAKVSYAQLLNTYWRNVDPLAVNRQFCDAGPQYRSAIFALDEDQRALAEASRAELSKRFGREVATEVLPAARFWPAEDYHQDYYLKNPIRYSYYRSRCGRDARLEALWGK